MLIVLCKLRQKKQNCSFEVCDCVVSFGALIIQEAILSVINGCCKLFLKEK